MKIYKQQTTNYEYVFDFKFSYDILAVCRHIKSKYGTKNITFVLTKWRFNLPEIVYDIKKFYPEVEVDVSMQDAMEKYEKDRIKKAEVITKAKEIKGKLDTGLNIKSINGELRSYQKIGVEFFVNSDGRGILADEMGAGKSLQALAYVAHTDKKKTLVICPASVKYSWEKEVKKWTDKKFIVLNSSDYESFTKETYEAHEIFIINYDIMKKYYDKLEKYKWDCMVCDEFHAIKNNTAARTKVVKAIGKKIPSVLLLSGTPLLNRPVELFNGLNLLDPKSWSDWFLFTKRYCQGHQTRFGWDATGASNIEELKNRISPFFLRRKKEDILKELPPKNHIEYPVKLEPAVMKQYAKAETSFIDYLRDVKKMIIQDEQATVQANKLAKITELRQLSSNGKLGAAKELVDNIVDSGDKVIVFSSYNQPLQDLKEYFKDKAVMITGSTDMEDRKTAIDRFQEDSSVKVFLGGIKSAGVGITLTAASNVVFLDYQWTPADHQQAEDRIHRIGQVADSVSIYQMIAHDTIDEYMKEVLEKKSKIINQLIDGEGPGKQRKLNITQDVIKKYEKLANK